ncbi:MAG: formate hydrogenlyase complex iron-sulfur subunit [Syntrophorhabdaceae bacterium PtaU1.Bin034]|nr:MAG: formate hydrogenlyase complex iron-sulfur subunit [Syntrophorhabdaceae bacterium PtaU1.Bin034]
MPRIVAGSCNSYDLPQLKEFLTKALSELNFSFKNLKVLLKPNLLSGKSPRRAVNTHPLLVRATAEVLLERGCSLSVGDSPGFESTEKALERSGIMEVVRPLGIDVAAFRKRVIKKIDSGISPYREFVFGEDPLDYDLVVNMPKLKTHVMMGLTAGVKNTFGFVPSLDKARWHLRCGTDKNLFASVLMDIHRIANPGLTILDGIAAMDGDGPSHGRVRHLGLIAASDNAFSLDAFLEKALSFPFPTPISSLAEEREVLLEAKVVDLGMPRVTDFKMPETMKVDFNLPSVVRETARKVLLRKPKYRAKDCNMCRTCADVCPAKAVVIHDNGVRFDYAKCIRCYCCHEMCPTGAIRS